MADNKELDQPVGALGSHSRRDFLKTAAFVTVGLLGLDLVGCSQSERDPKSIPTSGLSPEQMSQIFGADNQAMNVDNSSTYEYPHTIVRVKPEDLHSDFTDIQLSLISPLGTKATVALRVFHYTATDGQTYAIGEFTNPAQIPILFPPYSDGFLGFGGKNPHTLPEPVSNDLFLPRAIDQLEHSAAQIAQRGIYPAGTTYDVAVVVCKVTDPQPGQPEFITIAALGQGPSVANITS